jgi:hypothetical protein
MSVLDQMVALERAQQHRHNADRAMLDVEELRRDGRDLSVRITVWVGWAIWAALVAVALSLSNCSAVTAILAPEPLACDVRANLRCSTDPATGLQVCAVYCRTAMIWRQNCDGAVIRSGRLYCGDVGVLKLPGDVSEVAQ